MNQKMFRILSCTVALSSLVSFSSQAADDVRAEKQKLIQAIAKRLPTGTYSGVDPNGKICTLYVDNGADYVSMGAEAGSYNEHTYEHYTDFSASSRATDESLVKRGSWFLWDKTPKSPLLTDSQVRIRTYTPYSMSFTGGKDRQITVTTDASGTSVDLEIPERSDTEPHHHCSKLKRIPDAQVSRFKKGAEAFRSAEGIVEFCKGNDRSELLRGWNPTNGFGSCTLASAWAKAGVWEAQSRISGLQLVLNRYSSGANFTALGKAAAEGKNDGLEKILAPALSLEKQLTEVLNSRNARMLATAEGNKADCRNNMDCAKYCASLVQDAVYEFQKCLNNIQNLRERVRPSKASGTSSLGSSTSNSANSHSY